jgi:hypothetical protein
MYTYDVYGNLFVGSWNKQLAGIHTYIGGYIRIYILIYTYIYLYTYTYIYPYIYI